MGKVANFLEVVLAAEQIAAADRAAILAFRGAMSFLAARLLSFGVRRRGDSFINAKEFPMRMCLCLLAAGLLFTGNTLAEDTTKRELDKVQGHWRVVAAEQDGKRIPKEEIEKPVQAPPAPSGLQEAPWRRNRILIKGNRITIGDPGSCLYMTIKLNSTEMSNAVDLLIGGDDAFKGVYLLKEDELTICCAQANKARPTKLATKKGSGWTLLVLKREKR